MRASELVRGPMGLWGLGSNFATWSHPQFVVVVGVVHDSLDKSRARRRIVGSLCRGLERRAAKT